jgi:hypothetical protein
MENSFDEKTNVGWISPFKDVYQIRIFHYEKSCSPKSHSLATKART